MSKPSENRVNRAWAAIVTDIWKDDSGNLARDLNANPKEVFERYGVTIPDNVRITTLENKPGELHFVVPLKPEKAADLNDKDIAELYLACPGTQLDFGAASTSPK